MGISLTKKDYLTILSYYNKSVSPKAKVNNLKLQAEKILNDKLCRCIQKARKTRKQKYNNIGLCKSSVLHSKNLTTPHFRCKEKKRSITLKKRT